MWRRGGAHPPPGAVSNKDRRGREAYSNFHKLYETNLYNKYESYNLNTDIFTDLPDRAQRVLRVDHVVVFWSSSYDIGLC